MSGDLTFAGLLDDFLKDVPPVRRSDFMWVKNMALRCREEKQRDPSLLAGQHFGRQRCHPGYREVRSNDVGLEVTRYERKAENPGE